MAKESQYTRIEGSRRDLDLFKAVAAAKGISIARLLREAVESYASAEIAELKPSFFKSTVEKTTKRKNGEDGG